MGLGDMSRAELAGTIAACVMKESEGYPAEGVLRLKGTATDKSTHVYI